MIIDLLVWLGVSMGLAALILIPLGKLFPSLQGTLEVLPTFVREIVQCFTVVIASIVVARREGVTLATYGLPARDAFKFKFWEGIVWGFVMLSALIGMLVVLKALRIDSIALAGVYVWKYAFAWGAAFIALGVFEEFFFRGFLLFRIATRMNSFWSAAFVMAISFACAHLGNHGENVLGIVQVFVFALFASFALERTGSLWFPIGYHAAWDWAQTYFWGTPDSGLVSVGHYFTTIPAGPAWLSGGTGGPEGSVLCIVVLALSALVVHLRFPRPQFPLAGTLESVRDGVGRPSDSPASAPAMRAAARGESSSAIRFSVIVHGESH
jgi:membrane protease YdiL (CAAX protease family)